MASSSLRKQALTLILLLGVVSLFADMTYEGSRTITGPFLALLGASGTAVGIVVGAGEAVGYTLRAIFGYWADKTAQYWALTFVGYIINLAAVPLLALAENWPVASGLIVLERLGKAIRTPARDALLSHATAQTGRGWGFGLHQALDQIGGVLGPLLVAGFLFLREDYRLAFALLAFPAALAMAFLIATRLKFKSPAHLEEESQPSDKEQFTKGYWVYLVGVALVGLGYVHFALISYHFHKSEVITAFWIAGVYAIAMASDGLSALIIGWLFDRRGIQILALAAAIGALAAPLVFLGGFALIILGMICWGVGLGAQESLMRAVVAELVGTKRRGRGYGILGLVFGLGWWAGSSIMGFLYDTALVYLIIFAVVLQLASVPVFLTLRLRGP
jgi:MFS family permease